MAQVSDAVAIIAIVAPVATALGGYVLAGWNDEKRDQRAAAREETARRAALRERVFEQRHNFQRDVLLELQDVIRLHARATHQTLQHDLDSLRSGQGLTLLGQALNDEAFEVGISLGRLGARVLDDELRAAIESYADYTVSLEPTIMRLRGQSDAQILASLEASQLDLALRSKALIDQLGKSLRVELARIHELELPSPNLTE